MNFYKILLGILLMIGSVWYYSYITRNSDDDDDVSPIEKSYNIETYLGLAICFIIGLVMIYREFFN